MRCKTSIQLEFLQRHALQRHDGPVMTASSARRSDLPQRLCGVESDILARDARCTAARNKGSS
jgi:hypothetical protein